MKPRLALFLLLCCAWCGNAFATYTITTYLGSYTAPTNSCADFIKVLAAAGAWPPIGTPVCSSDPVVKGTSIGFNASTGRYGVDVYTIVNNAPATTPTGTASSPSSTASSTSAAASSPVAISVTVTVADAFGTAKPEQYKALTVLFSCALVALSSIWAAKRLYYVFINPNEN